MNSLQPQQFHGRNRRLCYEWQQLERRLTDRSDIACRPTAYNAAGLPVQYRVDYFLHSICGVEQVEQLGQSGVSNAPLFADHFVMQVTIPEGYPCIDAPVSYCFLTTDENGQAIAHPWHPNIRYFGKHAGRVCLNMRDTYTDIVWAVERVVHYLRYDLYHAVSEPPYPEDLQVAAWVIRQGEPNEWIFFNQEEQPISTYSYDT